MEDETVRKYHMAKKRSKQDRFIFGHKSLGTSSVFVIIVSFGLLLNL